MAINTPQLKTDLADLAENAVFDPEAMAELWRAAIVAWAGGVVPPSTTVVAAGAALKTALIPIFASTAPVGAAMDAAFQAFAVSVGTGMLPAFTPIPPPAPPGFPGIVGPPNPATHAAAGVEYGNLLDVWFLTGTANTVPSGPVVPWT